MGLGSKKIEGKPRLLIILNRFVIGGQAVDTLPLGWYLQNDFDILIAYGGKEKDEIEPCFLLEKYPGLRLKKIGFLRRSINPIIDVVAFFQLLSILTSFNPHIVHTHGAKSGFLGRLTAWLYRIPVIVHTFHGHFFHSYFSGTISRLIAALERAMGKVTTATVALSQLQKKELVEGFKIMPASKMTIIPLGFSVDEHDDDLVLRNSFREKYGLKNDEVAVGIVGRIVPVKNHSMFVQVVKMLLAKGYGEKAVFFVVGDGEIRKSVEAEFAENKIAVSDTQATPKQRVIFTSWLTNMDEVMNGLDIIALTSLNEGTPLSIIEAQFFRKPVVSTDVGGVKDTMANGITGFLVASNDTATFSNKLSTLIDDERLRFKMGDAGFALASERFSKQKEVEITKNFYFSLLQNKGFDIR